MSSQPSDIYATTLAVFDEADNPSAPRTTTEVADAADCERRTMYKRLETLVERGELQTKKVGASGRVWWRPRHADQSRAVDRSNDKLQRYERIIDAVGDPVYELDRAGRFTYVNQAAAELSGYDEDELLGTSVAKGMDPETVSRIEEIIIDLLGNETTQSVSLEYDVETKTGERLPVENHLALLYGEDGQFEGSAGILRDISERKAREQQLERTQTLLQNAERLGKVGGWEYDDREGQIYWTDGTRRIHEAGADFQPSVEQGAEFYHPEDRERVRGLFERCLENGAPYETKARLQTVAGDERWVKTTGEPIYEDGDCVGVRGHLQDITETEERKRELERQQRNLRTLNTFNEVVLEITEAVIEQSSREEIEQTVCEQLSTSDSYLFAWIADVDPTTHEITPRVEVGVDGYLDHVDISADSAQPVGQGPAGQAIRSQEMVVSRDVFEDPAFEPWRDAAAQFGYRSAAAIPITHEGTVYGQIGIYSERSGAFGEREQQVIGQLGEIVGHAITSVERKRALLSDEVVEMTFQLPNVFERSTLDESLEGTISIDRMVPIDETSFLVYGRATGDAPETLQNLTDDTDIEHWESMTEIETDGESTRFEARVSPPSLFATVSTYGGHIPELSIGSGSVWVDIHLPADTDVQQLLSTVRSTYPGIEMMKRQQTTRTNSPQRAYSPQLFEQLTDRQQAILEAGYFAGFFEWPRQRSGTEIAAALDISPPTFHQHIRTAEKTLLDLIFTE